MLFELFITIKLQIELLPVGIFPYYNLEFENDYKIIKQGNIFYHDFEFKYNIQEILLI
jgi:hypothetical protein